MVRCAWLKQQSITQEALDYACGSEAYCKSIQSMDLAMRPALCFITLLLLSIATDRIPSLLLVLVILGGSPCLSLLIQVGQYYIIPN